MWVTFRYAFVSVFSYLSPLTEENIGKFNIESPFGDENETISATSVECLLQYSVGVRTAQSACTEIRLWSEQFK